METETELDEWKQERDEFRKNWTSQKMLHLLIIIKALTGRVKRLAVCGV